MALSISRLLIVLAAAAVLAFSVLTAIKAFRSRIRHPWFWAFVSLLAAPVMTMNWTTGQVGTELLTIQLFGVGAVRPLSGSTWYVSVAFPVGALLFRNRRRQLIREHRPLVPDDQLP